MVKLGDILLPVLFNPLMAILTNNFKIASIDKLGIPTIDEVIDPILSYANDAVIFGLS